MPTKIPYCDETVNPLKCGLGKVWKYGYMCRKTSLGCKNCYAEPLNMRFGNGWPYDSKPIPKYELDLSVFDKLNKKKPQRVFVQDMSDLFLPGVPGKMINDIWLTMRNTPVHTFMLLTKHPKEMLRWTERAASGKCWPLNEIWPDNIHLGVTVCNQKEADEKIAILLQIPAAKRFVSVEPTLEEINFEKDMINCDGCGNSGSTAIYGFGVPGSGKNLCDAACPKGGEGPSIDWIIVGCESGPNRRGCKLEWIQSIVDQCADAGVPCFVKQVQSDGKSVIDTKAIKFCKSIPTMKKGKVSHNPLEWPESLRVQEFPKGLEQ